MLMVEVRALNRQAMLDTKCGRHDLASNRERVANVLSEHADAIESEARDAGPAEAATCGKVVLYTRSALNPFGEECYRPVGHDGKCGPVDPRGPGIIGSHWVEPSAAAKGRPRSAVTSGAPPAEAASATTGAMSTCSVCGCAIIPPGRCVLCGPTATKAGAPSLSPPSTVEGMSKLGTNSPSPQGEARERAMALLYPDHLPGDAGFDDTVDRIAAEIGGIKP